MRNTISSAFVAAVTTIVSAPAIAADTPGVIPMVAAQKLDNHEFLFTRPAGGMSDTFFWISSRVRPSDPGSQGLTWAWLYNTAVGGAPGSTDQIKLWEAAFDCKAPQVTGATRYRTFGRNINDFNMNMQKLDGEVTILVPVCAAGYSLSVFPELCALATVACEPSRFGAK